MQPLAVSKITIKNCLSPEIVEDDIEEVDDRLVSNQNFVRKSNLPSSVSRMSSNTIMSSELASNFAELKRLSALLSTTNDRNNSKKRPHNNDDEDDRSSPDRISCVVSGNNNDQKTQSAIDQQQRRRRLAEETAILAAQEVEHMRNAVAELEAMLRSGDNSCNIISFQGNEEDENEPSGSHEFSSDNSTPNTT